jgi:multidrug efflux system outer membrane protein
MMTQSPLPSRSRAGRRLAVLAAATALSACSMAPKYVRTEPPVPASWPIGDAYLRQSEASLPAITYPTVFTDRRLQTLITQALVNNRNLRVAAANIEAARAQYRIQRADLFPAVDATGRYTYSGGGRGASTTAGSGTGSGGTGGTGTGGTGTGGTGTGGTGGTGTGGTVVTSSSSGSAWSVGLGVTSFELDLFGRIRSLSRAALDRYFATEAGARATRITLVGDIADAWLTYAADQSLLKIAQDTAANSARAVELNRARLRGGISPRTDVAQAQQVLATAEADLALQRTLVAQDANALQLLVGAPIDPALLPANVDEAAATVAALPAGLDSGILLRRPDVVQAEYSLRAYNAEIGAARAALFPRISLTGLVGFASTALSSLFKGDAFTYSVAPNASYSIFQAGAARANVRYTQAQRDAALSTYELAIQTAFQETADALARQGTIAEQLGANRRNVAATADTLQLTDAAYRGGVTPFLNTLDAQRSLYTAQRTLVATQLTAASNRVTLYRVLGGDSSLEATADGPRPVTPSGAPRAEADPVNASGSTR